MEEIKDTTKKTTTKKTTKPAAKKTTTAKKSTTTKKTTTAKTTTTKKATTTPKKEVVEKKEDVNVNTTNNDPIKEVDAFAAISLVLGAASLITWLYPILGVAIAIPGLSMGIVTHETRRSNYSLLGIVMSLVGIILSIVKTFSM